MARNAKDRSRRSLIKERFQPVMKDIETRLVKLEKLTESPDTEAHIQVLKDKFRPVMQDIERRLIALEVDLLNRLSQMCRLQMIHH